MKPYKKSLVFPRKKKNEIWKNFVHIYTSSIYKRKTTVFFIYLQNMDL